MATPVLIDAGPLVALVQHKEAHHKRCMESLDLLRPPFATTWPVVTEALHIVGGGGWRHQRTVLDIITGLHVEVRPSPLQRLRALMERYRDAPMSLADASLVALAEEENAQTVFTLDSHFNAYLIKGKRHFRIIPELQAA